MGNNESDISFMITPGTVLVFEKSGTEIRVTESGIVPNPQADPTVLSEAQAIWDQWGHWIGIQHSLMEAGFEWVAAEILEDMAIDLLDDAAEEAANARRHIRLGSAVLASVEDRLRLLLVAVAWFDDSARQLGAQWGDVDIDGTRYIHSCSFLDGNDPYF